MKNRRAWELGLSAPGEGLIASVNNYLPQHLPVLVRAVSTLLRTGRTSPHLLGSGSGTLAAILWKTAMIIVLWSPTSKSFEVLSTLPNHFGVMSLCLERGRINVWLAQPCTRLLINEKISLSINGDTNRTF